MSDNPSQFIDSGNPLLQPTQSRIDTGSVTMPDGTKLGVLTLRTPDTTLSLFLVAEDFRQWSEILAAAADALEGKAKLAVATPGDAALLSQALKGR